MKKIMLLAFASILSVGVMANTGKKRSTKKQKCSTTCVKKCDPSCKPTSGCAQMKCHKG